MNLDELLEMLEGRKHVFTFSGHDTSNSWTVLLGEDEGRSPELPPIPHKTLAEVRVSLSGPFDDRGVRVSNMADGNPNGHYFFSFHGNRVKTRFEAARARVNQPSASRTERDDFQIRVSVGVSLDRGAIDDLSVPCPAPDFEPVGDPNYVVANVFDGTEAHELDGGPFEPMEHLVRTEDVFTEPDGVARPKGTAWCRDPLMVRFEARVDEFLADIEANLEAPQTGRFRPPAPHPSGHLWAASISTDLKPGVHVLEVSSRDPFGHVVNAHKVFEVCEEDFDSIDTGQVLGRDCIVLTAN